MSVAQVPEEVLRVCRDHYAYAPEIQRVVWFPAGEGDPIRLLDVDELAFPGDMVLPFTFAALDDYPACSVAVVTPEEWDRVKRREPGWQLPAGWDLDNYVEIVPDELPMGPEG
jgi:hypothetical protein